jgi:small subunit ribosomal protein S17
MKKEETQKNTGKVLDGVVISDKMTDTCVVEVARYFKHERYGKFIKRHKKYQVDDKGNTAKIGDKVTIVECNPISKNKHFTLAKNNA